jgi:hypothetical protein
MTKQLMTVSVRGVTYPSAKHCADHFKVKVGSVYSALARNAADTIGLGSSQGGSKRKPFTHGNLSWPSQQAASLALGFNRDYISKAQCGSRGAQKRLHKRLDEYVLLAGLREENNMTTHRYETASVHILFTMDALMQAHALANMHKVSGNRGDAEQCLQWFESIEQNIAAARADLEKTLKGEG